MRRSRTIGHRENFPNMQPKSCDSNSILNYCSTHNHLVFKTLKSFVNSNLDVEVVGSKNIVCKKKFKSLVHESIQTSFKSFPDQVNHDLVNNRKINSIKTPHYRERRQYEGPDWNEYQCKVPCISYRNTLEKNKLKKALALEQTNFHDNSPHESKELTEKLDNKNPDFYRDKGAYNFKNTGAEEEKTKQETPLSIKYSPSNNDSQNTQTFKNSTNKQRIKQLRKIENDSVFPKRRRLEEVDDETTDCVAAYKAFRNSCAHILLLISFLTSFLCKFIIEVFQMAYFMRNCECEVQEKVESFEDGMSSEKRSDVKKYEQKRKDDNFLRRKKSNEKMSDEEWLNERRAIGKLLEKRKCEKNRATGRKKLSALSSICDCETSQQARSYFGKHCFSKRNPTPKKCKTVSSQCTNKIMRESSSKEKSHASNSNLKNLMKEENDEGQTQNTQSQISNILQDISNMGSSNENYAGSRIHDFGEYDQTDIEEEVLIYDEEEEENEEENNEDNIENDYTEEQDYERENELFDEYDSQDQYLEEYVNQEELEDQQEDNIDENEIDYYPEEDEEDETYQQYDDEEDGTEQLFLNSGENAFSDDYTNNARTEREADKKFENEIDTKPFSNDDSAALNEEDKYSSIKVSQPSEIKCKELPCESVESSLSIGSDQKNKLFPKKFNKISTKTKISTVDLLPLNTHKAVPHSKLIPKLTTQPKNQNILQKDTLEENKTTLETPNSGDFPPPILSSSSQLSNVIRKKSFKKDRKVTFVDDGGKPEKKGNVEEPAIQDVNQKSQTAPQTVQKTNFKKEINTNIPEFTQMLPQDKSFGVEDKPMQRFSKKRKTDIVGLKVTDNKKGAITKVSRQTNLK